MGLSSSQARLLSLTGRMHDIEYKAQHLEAQKLQMANESRQVYQEYENALNATLLQYRTIASDGTTAFNNATYYNLCEWGGGCIEQLALVNMSDGKILLDDATYNVYTSHPGDPTGFALAMSGLTSVPVVPGTLPTSGPIAPTCVPTAPSSLPPSPTPDTTDICLYMSDTRTVTLGSDPIKIKLMDAVNHSTVYTYEISSNHGNQNVGLYYRSNGRLEITGNDFILEASSGQKDNLIILGNNNTIKTGDGDDIVRIGSPIGFGGNTGYGNTVESGSGNDYISVSGSSNQIFGGSGTDTMTVSSPSYTSNAKYGCEQYAVRGTVGTTLDGDVDAGYQGSLGDCRFLAFMNSLGNIGSYVDITPSGSDYVVNFKNYNSPYTGHGSQKEITIPKAEINSSHIASGDLDFVIVEYALNKLMGINCSGQNLQNCSYQEYARYILGNDDVSMYLSSDVYTSISGTSGVVNFNGAQIPFDDSNKYKKVSKELVIDLYNKKASGTISNLECGLSIADYALNAENNHAYTIKYADNNYVKLVNPWDNNDELDLQWSDFLRLCGTVVVYGCNYNKATGEISNGGASGLSEPDIDIAMIGVENIESDTPVINESLTGNSYLMSASVPTIYSYTGASAADVAKYNYYLNLYNLIVASGGAIKIDPALRTDEEYMINVLNNGAAYLKRFDTLNKEWVGTNIATNVNLQEVSNQKNLKKAEAKYEASMRTINVKDKKFDTDLAALDNERNAIKTEMDTLKTVTKDNVDRTFKLFS